MHTTWCTRSLSFFVHIDMASHTLLSYALAHWPLTLTLGAAVGVLVQLVRHAFADADFAALAAVRSYPRRGAFSGKVVFIVGASSGIGEALAYEFSRGGATVVVAARRLDQLERVAARCKEEGAAEAEAVQLDVTAFDSIEGVVVEVLRKHKRIDYLCNNAGRSQRGLVEKTPLAVDRDLFALNVFGVMSTTKAVLKHTLETQGALHICNTSSVAGKVGSPVSASYAASKHALQGWFDSLRMELGFRGCVAHAPAPLHTAHLATLPLTFPPSLPHPTPPPCMQGKGYKCVPRASAERNYNACLYR